MTAAVTQEAWKETVRENIRKGAELDVPFLLMNALAATIACYGLFANSPAIIIGAMIVAMLLGPTMAFPSPTRSWRGRRPTSWT